MSDEDTRMDSSEVVIDVEALNEVALGKDDESALQLVARQLREERENFTSRHSSHSSYSTHGTLAW